MENAISWDLVQNYCHLCVGPRVWDLHRKSPSGKLNESEIWMRFEWEWDLKEEQTTAGYLLPILLTTHAGKGVGYNTTGNTVSKSWLSICKVKTSRYFYCCTHFREKMQNWHQASNSSAKHETNVGPLLIARATVMPSLLLWGFWIWTLSLPKVDFTKQRKLLNPEMSNKI